MDATLSAVVSGRKANLGAAELRYMNAIKAQFRSETADPIWSKYHKAGAP
jgi:hypothetical protein